MEHPSLISDDGTTDNMAPPYLSSNFEATYGALRASPTGLNKPMTTSYGKHPAFALNVPHPFPLCSYPELRMPPPGSLVLPHLQLFTRRLQYQTSRRRHVADCDAYILSSSSQSDPLVLALASLSDPS
ncbi:hypothetical protein NMY22_g8156 [Coprinellus aureogranulatus]|nr:hypothetical protein NMY22_g8156 [Coprinellus aureogranulatus]